MKIFRPILFTFLMLLTLGVNAQLDYGISYQGVLRDGAGVILSNENVTVRMSITNATGAETYYTETHEVTTTPFGLITLIIGKGTVVTGNFAQIPWASHGVSLFVELKLGATGNFVPFEREEFQGVPYAFYAANGISEPNPQLGQGVVYNGNQWVANGSILTNNGSVRVVPNADHDPEEPIFSVLNSQNQVVFAIYESGIRAYVDNSDSKRPKGGFAVGGYSNVHGKDEEVYYLSVTPDSTRIYFNDADDGGKRPKGGFAVGGYSGAYNYLNVSPGHTQISFIDDGSKRPKGGFAVGGYSNSFGKDKDVDFFSVTPDSTRIYFNDADDGGKRPKGGFAVGGYSGAYNYLNVSPGHTQISFIDDGSKRPKGGFAVGGYSNSFGKDKDVDFFSVTPDSTRIYFNDADDGGKRPKGGFAVGGYSGAYNYLNVSPGLTQISFVDDGSKRPKGGFAVGGYSNVHGKAEGVDFLMVTPDSTRVLFQDVADGGKRPKGGFAVGGYSGAHNRNYLDVSATHTQVAFADDGSKRPKGGFAVGGYSSSIYKGITTDSDYFSVTSDTTSVYNNLYAKEDLIVDGSIIGGGVLDSLKDVEGNKYPIKKIGKQIWMTENLRSTVFNSGSQIGSTIPEDYLIFSDPDYPGYYEKYGCVYREVVVINDNDLCPDGWRIPTGEDWIDLFKFVATDPLWTDWTYHQILLDGLLGVDFGYPNTSGFSMQAGGFGESQWWNNDEWGLDKIGERGYYWAIPVEKPENDDGEYYFDTIDVGDPEDFSLKARSYGDYYAKSVRCIKE